LTVVGDEKKRWNWSESKTTSAKYNRKVRKTKPCKKTADKIVKNRGVTVVKITIFGD